MSVATAAPESPPGTSRERIGIVAVLALSALALAVAPRVMPVSYSWIRNAISESAAQGVPNAWVARLGLLLMGLGVLWLARLRQLRWGPLGHRLGQGFGIFMAAAAAFSHKPWQPGAPFDPTEDLLHSIAASGMGFAFAILIVVVALRRKAPSLPSRAGDLAALAASVLLPLGMSQRPEVAGLLQRGMFAIAYLWYGSEALRPP